MRDASRNTYTSRHHRASGLGPASCSFRSTKAHKHVQVPEWATESWKHRVEAEARKRLKHVVRNVARGRR